MFHEKELDQIEKIMGVALSQEKRANLRFYTNELTVWNRRVNLVSKKSAKNLFTEHIVPSLVYGLYMDMKLKYIDVGTGAGLPGLILKIVYPELRIDLLDSNRKKILFCKYIINELKIDNTEVILDRVENRTPEYDGALFRAFSSIDNLCKMSAHVLKPGGHFLSLKGKEEDLSCASIHIKPLHIPANIKNFCPRLEDSNMIKIQMP